MPTEWNANVCISELSFIIVTASASWIQWQVRISDTILTVLEWDHPGCIHHKAIVISHGVAL
jgi:hypothetical protein